MVAVWVIVVSVGKVVTVPVPKLPVTVKSSPDTVGARLKAALEKLYLPPMLMLIADGKPPLVISALLVLVKVLSLLNVALLCTVLDAKQVVSIVSVLFTYATNVCFCNFHSPTIRACFILTLSGAAFICMLPSFLQEHKHKSKPDNTKIQALRTIIHQQLRFKIMKEFYHIIIY